MACKTLVAAAMAAACGMLACGGTPNSPGTNNNNNNNNNPNTQLPQLRVTYAGFIGTSLPTSDPVRCASAECNMAAPAQVARPEGTYSYRVSAGTYRIDGILTGRPGPLTGPNFNVSAYIAVSLGWEIVSSLTLLGVERESVRFNGNPVSPDFAGPACGRFFESFTASQVITFTYTFNIVQYPITARPPNLCA